MFRRLLRAYQELGLPALSQFAMYRLALMSGYYRFILPIRPWSQIDLSRELGGMGVDDFIAARVGSRQISLCGLVSPGTLLPQPMIDDIHARAEAIANGSFQLFGLPPIQLGTPPAWHAFTPLADVAGVVTVDAGRHWSQYDLNALPHDVKLLWEPSRFGWVYPLAQAYALSRNSHFFEVFWSLYRSWLEANPPQAGLHWYSAQEVAIRLIALLFAAQTFRDPLNAAPERWVDLLKGIAVHARRIPPSLSYARAQKNNHLLLESAALYLTGEAFPEMRAAGRWKRLGRNQFESGLRDQVYPDGGYVQHSTNYQRLALQAGILVARCTHEMGEPLQGQTLTSLGKMAACLAAQVAGDSGELPNLGPNDGALLLPLSTRPFSDFRPTIQAAGKLFQGMDYFPPGPWDDLSHWLGITVEDATRVSPAQNLPEDLRQTGLYINRYDGLKTILRGISFINRPGHSDQLHLDIWYEGVNVARDPGTYLYNGLPPWDNPLTGAWCHNTIMLDGREPMLKGGRFLWLNWSDATVRRHRRSADRAIDVLFASHQARQWAGLTQQRSVVIIRDDMVIVVDEVLGEGEHQVLLNWNLADLPWGIKGSTIALEHQQFKASLTWPAEAGAWGLFRAGARLGGEAGVKDPELYGWDARTYARKEPGLQLVVQLQGALPLRMLSTWGFNAPDMNQLAVDWQDVRKDELPFSGVRWGDLGWEA